MLGLIGDNGAGKSTLIKILSGFQQPDSGSIFVNGEEVTLRSVDHARSLGIDTVYQDLALVPTLSVAHNMFLKRELPARLGPVPLAGQRGDAEALPRVHRRDRNRDAPLGERRGRDALRRAAPGNRDRPLGALRRPDLLLDEPLAAMGAKEGEIIIDLIHDLKKQGHSMIVVAHNFIHIVEICDRVNLLQHGRITFDKPIAETSAEELTEIVAAEYRQGRTTISSRRMAPPRGDGTRDPDRARHPVERRSDREEGREEGPE